MGSPLQHLQAFADGTAMEVEAMRRMLGSSLWSTPAGPGECVTRFWGLGAGAFIRYSDEQEGGANTNRLCIDLD